MTKREMIIEGIEAVKDRDYWISSHVIEFVHEKYGVRVDTGYVNSVRRNIGEGWEQGFNKRVKQTMQDMLDQMP